jgi:hypothetical protein
MIEGFSDFDLGMVGLGGWEIGLFEEDEKKKIFLFFFLFLLFCSQIFSIFSPPFPFCFNLYL